MDDILYDVNIYIDKTENNDKVYIDFLVDAVSNICGYPYLMCVKIVADMIYDGHTLIYSSFDPKECVRVRDSFLSYGIQAIIKANNCSIKKK